MKPTDVRVTGPLTGYTAGFCDELAARRYTPLSAANQVRVMAHLSRWLARRRLRPAELSVERIEQFLRHRRRAGYTCWRSKRGLEPLLTYLRRIGVVPHDAPRPLVSVLDRLVDEYVEYLGRERGLGDTTIQYRQAVARDFLSGIAAGDDRPLGRLDAQFVTRYMFEAIHGYSVGAAGLLATAVRSLLRFLHVRGHVSAPLTGAVPKLAGWRQTSLPRAVEPECVELLLDACDRRTAVGRRDYAMLLLLARLGLRAGEVAALRLEDLDWRQGEIVVHGKGHRDDRLPLPADVGEAVAAYLRRGRPECDVRVVFVGHRAPHRALRSSAVSSRVTSMSRRAGLTPPIGAHRLRHTAATQMLRKGSSLDDIAQVLRHRSPQTTAIYAKVDRESLRSLAQPWPGGEP
jgi:site-specific recombinase XerD